MVQGQQVLVPLGQLAFLVLLVHPALLAPLGQLARQVPQAQLDRPVLMGLLGLQVSATPVLLAQQGQLALPAGS